MRKWIQTSIFSSLFIHHTTNRLGFQVQICKCLPEKCDILVFKQHFCQTPKCLLQQHRPHSSVSGLRRHHFPRYYDMRWEWWADVFNRLGSIERQKHTQRKLWCLFLEIFFFALLFSEQQRRGEFFSERSINLRRLKPQYYLYIYKIFHAGKSHK